jgi:hypothetical protein
VITPKGHVRDGGPFESVQKDYLTDDVLNQAIDDAYDAFYLAFPELPKVNNPVTLNDDYVMWIPQAQTWAAGVEYSGNSNIGVTIWHRIETQVDPGDAFIVRPPGVYWGYNYSVWRHTGFPLVPAIPHELLHVCIGDPNHTSPLWSRCP